MKYLFALFFTLSVHAASIDVLIPAVEKDLRTLDLVIDAIRENCKQVGRVIVISKDRLTEKAEWFPESRYPFSIRSVAEVFYIKDGFWRQGWYFQQLLKIYAPIVIPNLSEHFLFLDSDCIFLRPLSFVSKEGKSLLHTTRQFVRSYFSHAKRMLPQIVRKDPMQSGIADHMPMQKSIVFDLIRRVEDHHGGMPFWKVFLAAVDPILYGNSGASEFEILFNFALEFHPEKIEIRKLKSCWSSNLSLRNRYRAKGYDFVSFHSWMVSRPKGRRPLPMFTMNPSKSRLVALRSLVEDSAAINF